MRYEEYSVAGDVEILASKDYQAIPIKVAAPGGNETVVKAGTPLSAAGAESTDSGTIGILLYDVDTAANPNGAVVVQGVIDAKKAQAHSGITYEDAVMSALPGIVFRTNIGVNT